MVLQNPLNTGISEVSKIMNPIKNHQVSPKKKSLYLEYVCYNLSVPLLGLNSTEADKYT